MLIRSLAAVLLCPVLAGCGQSDARSTQPAELMALRIQTGNPPQRSIVLLRERGPSHMAARLPLPRGLRVVDATWRPDGTHVLVTAGGIPSDDRRTDIYSFDVRGKALTRLTSSADAGVPTPSPDGRWIAYSRRVGTDVSSLRFELWIMDADGSNERRLLAQHGRNLDLPSSWSPDSRRLAFTRCQDRPYGSLDQGCAIYTVERDGSGLRKLTDSGLQPDWSPDGHRIAFASTRDRTGTIQADEDTARYAAEIYVMDADGAHQHRLTTTTALDETSPRWSPAGTRIAYTRRGSPFPTRIFEINGDGTCTTAITRARDDRWHYVLDWRPLESPGESPLRCAQ